MFRALLHRAQEARRFSSSYQSPPIETGRIWSTSTPEPVQPGPLIWQRCPSRSRTFVRTFFHGPEYWGFLAMSVAYPYAEYENDAEEHYELK